MTVTKKFCMVLESTSKFIRNTSVNNGASSASVTTHQFDRTDSCLSNVAHENSSYSLHNGHHFSFFRVISAQTLIRNLGIRLDLMERSFSFAQRQPAEMRFFSKTVQSFGIPSSTLGGSASINNLVNWRRDCLPSQLIRKTENSFALENSSSDSIAEVNSTQTNEDDYSYSDSDYAYSDSDDSVQNAEDGSRYSDDDAPVQKSESDSPYDSRDDFEAVQSDDFESGESSYRRSMLPVEPLNDTRAPFSNYFITI